MSNLIKTSLLWSFLNVFISRGSALSLRLFCGALLLPAEFGTYSYLNIVIGLTLIIVDFGLGNSFVQRDVIKDRLKTISSLFWVSVVIGFTIFTICIFLDFLDFLDNSKTEDFNYVYTVCGLVPLMYSFSVAQSAMLMRRMKIKQLAKLETACMLFSVLLASLLFFLHPSVLSLISQQIIYHVLRSFVIIKFTKAVPINFFDPNMIKNLLAYGLWTFLSRLLFFFRMNLSTMILIFFSSKPSVGLFSMSFLVTEVLRQQIAAVVDRVMFPVFSRHQTDPNFINKLYMKLNHLMISIFYPIFGTLFIFSDIIVNKLFGDSWLGLDSSIRVMCFSCFIFATFGPCANVMQAIGKAKTLFKISLISLLFFGVPSSIILVYFLGPVGAASAFVFTFFIQRIASFWIIKQKIGVSISEILQNHIEVLCLLILLTLVTGVISSVWISLIIVSLLSGIFTAFKLYIFFIRFKQDGEQRSWS